MSWYVHPSRQLRDDELPPELVVTNRDGSIVQAYVPYDATGEQLKAENAKLREELDQWHSLTAGIELPEYPVTQFKPKDLERENAELRELVRDMWFWSYCGHIDNESQEKQMAHIDSVLERMRELGVEVGYE